MPKSCYNSSKAPAVLGPYSQAVMAGGFVFLSGQLGLDPVTDELVSGGVQAQTRRALLNISGILGELGLTMSAVVKSTVFLRDIGDFTTVNGVYAEAFHAAFPARSAIQAAALPKEAAVEIEVIASLEQV
ncbi:MAG: Rid family detoxifying hydrolase [Spirochaetes bacterium]|nr:Rid family detoxifying hydrolase [Spirochaetota bacterium]